MRTTSGDEIKDKVAQVIVLVRRRPGTSLPEIRNEFFGTAKDVEGVCNVELRSGSKIFLCLGVSAKFKMFVEALKSSPELDVRPCSRDIYTFLREPIDLPVASPPFPRGYVEPHMLPVACWLKHHAKKTSRSRRSCR